MAFRLDAERGIPELAKMAGVSDDTMRRRLVALHEQRGNVLVIYKRGNRTIYKSTLSKLRKACPHMFLETQLTKSDADELKEKVRDLNRQLNALAASHRDFQRRAHEWFTRSRR